MTKVYFSPVTIEAIASNLISGVEAKGLQINTKGMTLASMAQVESCLGSEGYGYYGGKIKTTDGIFEYNCDREIYVQA